MTSGIIPWKRQLELRASWLEIIADEFILRGGDLSTADRSELDSLGRIIADRVQSLLDGINPDEIV
jgi:hypothetical protein